MVIKCEYSCLYNIWCLKLPFPEYCEAYCQPSFYQSSYLPIIGAELNLGIDILWTGYLTIN